VPDPASPRGARLVPIAAVHAALIAAGWLFAALVYAVVIAHAEQAGWIAIDLAVIAGCGALVYARRDALGFRSLGDRRIAKLLAILALATASTLIVHLMIRDRNAVGLDESHYLATLRAGHILRGGRLPFNMRWLMPMLAGRWNLLPVDDMDALKALNFGALSVTAWLLVLLLVRLRIRLALAIAAPVFLLCSYLGVYGATNRLVLDAFNYAMYAVLFHLVLRRAHVGLFAVVLVVAACNSEKAIYWLPVLGLVELLRREPGRAWWLALRRAVLCAAAVMVYLIAIRLYLADSTAEWNATCFENLDAMALLDLGARAVTPATRTTTFQQMWLPFGPFTIYALLGFAIAPRALKPVALLVVPIALQSLLVCDSERMAAYAFIVYLPFGYLYLGRALTDLPRPLARVLFGLSVALPIAERYGIPLLPRLRRFELAAELHASTDLIRMALSAAALVTVGTLVFIHLTWFAPRFRED
jgi:hypothetical protein